MYNALIVLIPEASALTKSARSGTSFESARYGLNPPTAFRLFLFLPQGFWCRLTRT